MFSENSEKFLRIYGNENFRPSEMCLGHFLALHRLVVENEN